MLMQIFSRFRSTLRNTFPLFLFILISFFIISFFYGSAANASSYTFEATIDGASSTFPYEIKKGGIYEVKGTKTDIDSITGGILVLTEDPVTLVLDNANFTTENYTPDSAKSKYSALVIGTTKKTAGQTATADTMYPDIKANVTIVLKADSDNSFISMSQSNQADAGTAGINVRLGSTLTIQSEDAATNPGHLKAKGGWYAAGIGAGPNQRAGTIIIEG